MENKGKLNLPILLFNGLFTAICICLLVVTILQSKTTFLQNIEILADIVACLVALIYLIEGYSKAEATHYRLCMIVAAINALVVTFLSVQEKVADISTVMCAAAFVLTAILAFTKNLGKRSSYICCGFLVFVRLSGLLTNIFTESSNPQYSIIIIMLVSQLSLALLIGVITYAKYVDKYSRGSN